MLMEIVKRRRQRTNFRDSASAATLSSQLGKTDAFRVITPIGTFQMTKADFYREFQNVAQSKSYREGGIYHYPKLPARAERYRIS